MSTSDPDAVFAALRGADPDVMDRDELAVVVKQCAQIVSWADSVKVRATRRLRALADEGRAEAPIDLLAREGGQSGRDARTADDREKVCTALPDFESALAGKDPVERTGSLLLMVYRDWYRDQRAMWSNIHRDRRLDPALDEFMRENSDTALSGIADALTAGFELSSARAEQLRPLIRLALDFWTWERLTAEGLDDERAAAVMTDAIASAAGDPATAR